MSFNRIVKDREKKHRDPIYSDMYKVRSRYINEEEDEDEYGDLINIVKTTRMNVSDFIDDHGCDVN